MAKGQLLKSRGRASFTPPEQINLEELDPDDPQNDVERRFLQDHDLLGPDEPRQPVFFYLEDGTKVSNDPTLFREHATANNIDIDALVQARAQELAAEMIANAQLAVQTNMVGGEESGHTGPVAPAGVKTGQVSPDPAGKSFDDGEGGYDYSSSTGAELRAELSNRGLSIDGKKDELVARLAEDDAQRGQGSGEVSQA